MTPEQTRGCAGDRFLAREQERAHQQPVLVLIDVGLVGVIIGMVVGLLIMWAWSL